MKITKGDLEWAASVGVISPQQADELWAALCRRTTGRQRFDAAHVAYYFGALLVIAAMGWFMTTAWESLGGGGLFLIALLYAVFFVLAGRALWDRQGLRVPGGLLYTMAVFMTPLAVYGLQRALGIWPQGDPGVYRSYHIWVKGSWLLMELATIAAALFVLRARRFPYLTAPIAFSLWYISMDLTPLLFGKNDFTWDERKMVSVWFGLAMLFVAYWVDLRGRRRDDFAFWGYLFGLMAFWGGLSLMESDSQLSKFLYCLINIGLVGLSVLLRQRAFIVFGSLGVFGYLGYLAHSVFADSLLFPFALSLIGVLVIYLGVVYQKNGQRIELFAQTRLPAAVRRLVPARARISQ
jgi:hypothetical protein